MPRTVVYDEALVQAELEDTKKGLGGKATGPTAAARRTVNRRPRRASAEDKEKAADLPVKDDYTAKIAKYVPAEVIAVSAAGFAAFDPTGGWIWFAIALGIVANLLYLIGSAVRLDPVSRPRWFFYVLSAVAFLAWGGSGDPSGTRQVRAGRG